MSAQEYLAPRFWVLLFDNKIVNLQNICDFYRKTKPASLNCFRS